jgi:hypothetical protein
MDSETNIIKASWRAEARSSMTLINVVIINAVMTTGKSKTTEQPKVSKMVRRNSCEAIMVMMMKKMVMMMAMMILCVDGEFVYECPSFRIVSAMKAAQKVAE